ncbi:hypothetical protein VTN31DRAFT_2047 [Thermomyces dupontii]|uniref:uncharacterized protein n=1 Tax=Talaromyces thermophilus TaxID=28565 RepID=UPI0037440AA2
MLPIHRSALQQSDTPATLAYARRKANEQFKHAFREYWSSQMPRSYRELEMPLEKGPTEWKLPRYTLGKLYACRTEHGDFEDYHIRFGHEDAECLCKCGRSKSPTHFYFCRRARGTPAVKPQCNLRDMLATAGGAQEFHRWITATQFYNEICPMGRRKEQRDTIMM